MRRLREVRFLICSGVALVALFTAVVLGGCGDDDDDGGSKGGDTVRIGWQVPWATQGQVVQALKHTDVLDGNGVRGEFKGFSYGAPLNEAALAGEVDVLLTADQPAATLLANSDKFTIVGRLMNNRVAIYVPPDSPIRSVEQLEGKTVAMPFGAAAQRDALKAIKAAGLDPKKDVKSINLDVSEHASIANSGSSSDWGKIDALVGFDPTPAILETGGKARMLHVGTVVAVVVMSNDLLRERRDVARRVLKSYVGAWGYYAGHARQANDWFKEEARFDFPGHRALDIAASVEPNTKAASVADLKVLLSPADMRTLQEAADFIYDNELVRKHVTMADRVDQRLMEEAFEESRDDSDEIRAQ